jgi:carbon-monoxide dehydrogenase large subunit
MEPMTAKFVGARVKRVEDPRYLTGTGRYVDDIDLPGMLHAVFLRCPHGHARIRAIDTSAAARASGVKAVLTGADMARLITPVRTELAHLEHHPTEWPVIAIDTVRYAGEAVAVVVAEDRYAAEDATELIRVDYAPLPAVYDAEQGLQTDAPRVHDDWPDNIAVRSAFSGEAVEQAFAQADFILQERFRTEPVTAIPMEPRGCLASYDRGQQSLTLWTSTQIPHIVRTLIADLLHFPEQRLRVIAPDVGGGFGIKAHLYPEELVVCVLAQQLAGAVKWIQDRREEIMTNVHCRDHFYQVAAAVRRDGVITGVKARVVADMGAYMSQPFGGALESTGAARMLLGPYKIQHYAYEAFSIASNKSPRGAYRGVSMAAVTFVMERLMDTIAQRTGLDPAQVRFKNMVQPEDFPYVNAVGVTYDSASFVASLQKALEMLDYEALRAEQARLRAAGRYIGIGISCYAEITAQNSLAMQARGLKRVPGYDTSTIRVEPSGKVIASSSVTSQGTGMETVMAQVIADELGVDIAEVTVVLGDTSTSPYGSGTWSSRGAVGAGGSCLRATRKIRDKMLRLAAAQLEASPDDLEMRAGQINVRGTPARFVTFEEVARLAYMVSATALPAGIEPGLEATEYYDPPRQTVSNAAQIAVAEVDVETGQVHIQRYVIVHDCGKVLNPMIVDGQIHGATAQGLGEGLYEAVAYDERGQVLNASLMEYLVPTAVEIPTMEVGHLETLSPYTEGGVKGMGEGGTVGAPAAIANAVADALAPFGVQVNAIPLTPERILTLIRTAARPDQGS